jgi:hypothetical protein
MTTRARNTAVVVAAALGLATFWLLGLPARCYSQQNTAATTSGLRGCRGIDLETNLQIVTGPSNLFTVAFTLRNISDVACLLDHGSYGANGSPTVPDRTAPNGKVFSLSSDSDNRVSGARPSSMAPLTLQPGKFAYMTISWKTEPQIETDPCIEPVAINWPALVVAPLLLKPLCSDVEVSEFALGAFPNVINSGAAGWDDAGKGVLRLMSDRSQYYRGERFFLHVSRDNADAMAPTSDDVCPTVYLRERSSDGRTLFRAKSPNTFVTCHWPTVGEGGAAASAPAPGDWKSGFDLNPDFSDTLGNWDRLEEHSFQVFEVVAVPDNGSVRFVHSNTLRIHFADASAITRKWSQHQKGLGVNVTLDKDTFGLGEDIPLHLAVENFDSAVPVYGSVVPDSLCGVGQFFTIEVHNAAGQVLSTGQRSHGKPSIPGSVCLNSVSPYPKGQTVSYEATLGQEGWLPNHPGTYTVVVTLIPWVESRMDSAVPGGIRPAPKDYANVRSEATLYIIDRRSSASN